MKENKAVTILSILVVLLVGCNIFMVLYFTGVFDKKEDKSIEKNNQVEETTNDGSIDDKNNSSLTNNQNQQSNVSSENVTAEELNIINSMVDNLFKADLDFGPTTYYQKFSILYVIIPETEYNFDNGQIISEEQFRKNNIKFFGTDELVDKLIANKNIMGDSVVYSNKQFKINFGLGLRSSIKSYKLSNSKKSNDKYIIDYNCTYESVDDNSGTKTKQVVLRKKQNSFIVESIETLE